jgi:hypothetical protein
MGNGVNKAVLLIAAANLTDHEDGVNDQARNDQGEKYDPENEWYQMAAMHHDPADIQEDGHGNEAGAQRDEEGYLFVSSGHGDILLGIGLDFTFASKKMDTAARRFSMLHSVSIMPLRGR